MKTISNISVLICLLILSLSTGCKTDGQKAKIKKPKTSVAKGKKAKNKKQIAFQQALKTKLKLSDKQIASVKSINKNYNLQVKNLKKAKKWDGAANKSKRAAVNKAKQSKLKKVLGKSYNAYSKMTAPKQKKVSTKKTKK